MLNFKEGVNARDLNANIVLALIVADQEYARAGVECVVTALRDGKHRENSRHYVGLAVDLRTRHLTGDDRAATAEGTTIKQNLATRIGARLPDGYHCSFEPTNDQGRTEHIHIEFRPMELPQTP